MRCDRGRTHACRCAEVVLLQVGVNVQSQLPAHRRFQEWPRVHRAVLDELGSRGELDWARVVVDSAAVRAKKGAMPPAPALSIEASPDRNCTF